MDDLLGLVVARWCWVRAARMRAAIVGRALRERVHCADRVTASFAPLGLPTVWFLSHTSHRAEQRPPNQRYVTVVVEIFQACHRQHERPVLMDNRAPLMVLHSWRYAQCFAEERPVHVTLHQHQYRPRPGQRTRPATVNIAPEDACALTRRCRGRRGICSRTGTAHWGFQDYAPSGGAWAAIAAGKFEVLLTGGVNMARSVPACADCGASCPTTHPWW